MGVEVESENMTPPRSHSCWVCASREAGYVGEPNALVKAQTTVEDTDVLGSVSHVFKSIGRVRQALGAVGWIAVVLLVSATVAEARDFRPSDGTQTLRLALLASASMAAIGLVVMINAARYGASFESQRARSSCLGRGEELKLDEAGAKRLAESLSRAIRLKTISFEPDDSNGDATDFGEFLKFHKLIEERFPRVHASSFVKRTVVNSYSLLYEWSGLDDQLAPIMLCAHMDVVPTPAASSWSIDDPFSGEIDANGVIWGRGAIDNKHNVIAQLEALETLLSAGVEQPERTVYFAFGHDEEIGGEGGAMHIGAEVKRRLKAAGHSALAFLIDEGPFLIKNVLPGLTEPIGLIGTTEKGSVSVKLSVSSAPPGHSSMPDASGQSNVAILTRAISRLEARPFPAVGLNYLIECWEMLGRELPLSYRVIFGNSWLFRPLLRKVLLQKNATAASVRTTTAITILRAGTKINVLPGEATACINHRIHPGDISHENVIAYDRKVINDPRVDVSLYGMENVLEPSPVTPTDAPQFRTLQRIIRQVFNAASVPNVMIGNTDTKHYWQLFDEEGGTHIFRFSPVVFECLEDTQMFHGIDERISTENLVKLHEFYVTLLSSVSQLDDPAN
ncbi:N-fatty-acyl-amino acid synthase/hydrolase PM20D1 [Hondaea fermentalgiana]|uniref:N-fatty-acyl-amino acid synthase/hydrolase PM20D1 n=1 Tax=Hondaea fermentalgiana TaxID=2315210 RepID=A0A2R5GHT4_9STRA|nr:N-fatty-acyl-amino acid synthase/hydrolase PM20D1 [Hondaea fermentalgiana]|eukprot:GBG27851.1 N-fatty-acyl-amino acid synthase/hydrolase PM20D1 [Hondaea fermentalgiana]